MTARPLELMDWKRRMAALYAAVRAAEGSAEALRAFRRGKDELFARHPQSPLPAAERAAFVGLDYFPYRPDLRIEAALEPQAGEGGEVVIPTGTGEPTRVHAIGAVRLNIDGQHATLTVYWLAGYGGGLYLPFADALAGQATYGGGRYLLDTVKGADLGSSADGERLVLDFNYAYHPSCAYDPRWSCPLAPPENHLDVAVEAGERTSEWRTPDRG